MLTLVLTCLLAVPAGWAQEQETEALPAESVIAILRVNPDLIGPMKEVAIHFLQTHGVAVAAMTDEGLFSEIRSDAGVRLEITNQLRAQGYVAHAQTATPPAPAPPQSASAGQARSEEAPRTALPPAPHTQKAGVDEYRPRKVTERSRNTELAEAGMTRYPASDHPSAFLRNFAQDQKDIWTSPAHVRVHDLNWLLPFAGATGGLISSDAEVSSRITSASLISHSGTFSNVGVGVLLGGSGALYLMGRWGGNEHQKETGILALEAAGNGFLVSEGFKIMTARQRPTEGMGQGDFFTAAPLSSGFPSQHATIAWSVASVIAHEYPGTLTQILAYGLAAGVSASRVTSRNHFPSDVLVGSVAGYLIGRQVYARHHDPELPGSSFGQSESSIGLENIPARNLASPYVPLDSWIYPAFERLAGLGVIPSGMLGLRPWTRMECARLLNEATGMSDDAYPDEAWRLYHGLEQEFAPELEHPERRYLQLDSVYFRGTGIGGEPLTDGYHFGQTIVNDFGRPYQNGFNAVAGFSASSSFGPMGFYIRGEYQHAPSAPGYPQAVVNAITATDLQLAPPIPFIPASPIPATNQFRLLDAYAMFNFQGFQASFGKESLWLGPTMDPFLASDNAVPMYMFRLDQTQPRKMPGLLGKLLGIYRTEFWFGRLAGQQIIDPLNGGPLVISTNGELDRQPFINGFKVNFKPTQYFEFGVGKTGLFGGPAFPITLGTFKNSFFSVGNNNVAGLDPGDRRSTFDFSYHIPGLRKWLILYNDSFVEDEISPIGYPRRAAQNQGLYMPQVPFLHKLDLRVEGGYTNLPGLVQPPQGGFFYWNVRYVDGYTNDGNIIGDATLGRQGIAFRAESNYWAGANRTIGVGYRNQEVDPMFLQGGSLRDIYIHSEWAFNPQVSLTSFLQYEWWNFPLLSNGNQRNDFTASFQITYRPHWKLHSEHQ